MARDPSKTEPPTQKRIEEARDEGNVLFSVDVNSVIVLIGGALLIWVSSHFLLKKFSIGITSIFHQMAHPTPWDGEWLRISTYRAILYLGETLAPFLIGIFILIIISCWFQTGNYFSLGPLEWKFERLNPANGLKSLLPTTENLVKLGLTLLKVFLVGIFVYWTLMGEIRAFIQLPRIHLLNGLKWTFSETMLMSIKIMLFFIIVAVLDYLYQRHEYYENLKMTKQEVKDELRSSEGDPLVKGRIRRRMVEISFMRMITEIPKADVVVTNPIHVAVALKYTFGTYAPRVIAKGLRKRALRIREIAQQHGVPIVEAPALARSLYRHTPVGGYIPEHLFQAVAIILAKIHHKRRQKQSMNLDSSTIQKAEESVYQQMGKSV